MKQKNQNKLLLKYVLSFAPLPLWQQLDVESFALFEKKISSNGPPVPDRRLLATTTIPAKIPIGFFVTSKDNFSGRKKAIKGSKPSTK